MTRGVSPWRALAQSGISLKWEDPRPSGRGVCQHNERAILKLVERHGGIFTTIWETERSRNLVG